MISEEPFAVTQPRAQSVRISPSLAAEAVALVVLALAAVTLSGCESEREAELETQVKRLSEETADLRKHITGADQERRDLQKQVKDLLAENARLNEQVGVERDATVRSKEEVHQLRSQLEAMAAARPAGPELTRAPEQAGGVETRTEREKEGDRLEELKKAIAELEVQKTNARARINAGQAEVSALTRATIDVPMQVPPHGMVKDGQVYRRMLIDNAPYYQYVPIGPAIKEGDFRTQRDKDQAIQEAKVKLLPLFEEVRAMDAQLEPLKSELAQLVRQGARQDEVAPPDEGPSTILKHKQTGETIKGILTEAKINNLRVFKLADGGTKFINPDEWEALETDP